MLRIGMWRKNIAKQSYSILLNNLCPAQRGHSKAKHENSGGILTELAVSQAHIRVSYHFKINWESFVVAISEPWPEVSVQICYYN